MLELNFWQKMGKLSIYLKQGRTIEIDGLTYGMGEGNQFLRMINDDEGLRVNTIDALKVIVNKISDDEFFIINSEIALTKMKREKII